MGGNPAYWLAKIRRNITRDRRVTRALQRQGWAVVRVWESDVLENARRVAVQIVSLARKRTRIGGS